MPSSKPFISFLFGNLSLVGSSSRTPSLSTKPPPSATTSNTASSSAAVSTTSPITSSSSSSTVPPSSASRQGYLHHSQFSTQTSHQFLGSTLSTDNSVTPASQASSGATVSTVPLNSTPTRDIPSSLAQSISPSPTPVSAENFQYMGGANNERRNSISSLNNHGNMGDSYHSPNLGSHCYSTSPGEKWWIGGRTSDGHEKYYRLEPL